jgi:electron transfer flavoprotein alpha subunit
MSILCYVAMAHGSPTRASLEVLTRCRGLAGDEVEAVVLSSDGSNAADVLARYGARRVHLVIHPVFDRHLNKPVLDALAHVIQEVEPAVVAFPSTEGVKDVLGALAARLDAPALPDVSTFEIVDGGVEATRPVMATKFQAQVRAEGSPVLVSVRAGSFAAEEAPVDAEIVEVAFDHDLESSRQTLREAVGATSAAADLGEARIVVAAGRGVRDDEGRRLLEELAEVTGAAIGATRAVVETGMYPATAQIGQTGKVVSPDVYFAVGLSGAIQHVAGVTGSRVIVAINKDPDAAIFNIATYGLVGDLYEILPALIDELRRRKG